MKIYEMKRHILFILTLLLFFHAKSQPNCIFTHYSSENGLSQNSIMSMVQDHNGVLWFSTWDGINRFNGYDFKVYKARQGNKITMTNNRVDLLEVDPYNYIWLQTYDYRVYRFDQRTEKFEQIPAEGEEEGILGMTERQIGCYLSIMTPIHPIGTFPINYIPCYPISKAIFGYVLILRGWRRLLF